MLFEAAAQLGELGDLVFGDGWGVDVLRSNAPFDDTSPVREGDRSHQNQVLSARPILVVPVARLQAPPFQSRREAT